MRRFLVILFGIVVLCMHSISFAQTLQIAAASDLKFALDAVVNAFESEHNSAQNPKISIIYGSSGKLHTQIMQGAPYDLFFSADVAYPNALKKQGVVVGEVMPYGVGRIVVWRLKSVTDTQPITLQSLTEASVKHIAIANPAHAPYGKRATEALMHLGIMEHIKSKLVFGENIAQATQFVQTGNAEIGIIALSLALSPTLADIGEYYLIPGTYHSALIQALVITKRAENNQIAKDFVAYLGSDVARKIFLRYGFKWPNSEDS